MPKNPLARMFIYGAIATAILLAVALSIDWFPQQGSTSAGKIDTLYDVLLVASVPIFVLVMTVAIYSVIRFRAKPGDTGDGAPIHGNARLEVAWVTLPFLLVTGLAIYAWITLNDIEKKQKGEMVVRVWGRQFAWSFGYTAPNGRYVASDQLYLPVDKPVKFLIRTRDVIHSFWIPDFRLQADAVPGITTDWRTTPTRLGLHDVVCVELCGQGHALMRSTARVVSDQTFTAWITRQSGGGATAVASTGRGGAKTATAAAGMQLFAANGCGACHTLKAAGSAGRVGPDLDRVVQDAAKYAKGKPAANYIRQSIVSPNAFIVPGYPAGTMPQTFGKQLSPQQINSLVKFLIAAGGGGGKKK